MTEDHKQPETISENPEVIVVDNTTDTSNSEAESSVDSVPTDETDLTAEDGGVTSNENEEIFAAFQQENAHLKQLLDEKTQQAEFSNAQYARLAADFENFRRRTVKEKENLELQVKKNVITEFRRLLNDSLISGDLRKLLQEQLNSFLYAFVKLKMLRNYQSKTIDYGIGF